MQDCCSIYFILLHMKPELQYNKNKQMFFFFYCNINSILLHMKPHHYRKWLYKINPRFYTYVLLSIPVMSIIPWAVVSLWPRRPKLQQQDVSWYFVVLSNTTYTHRTTNRVYYYNESTSAFRRRHRTSAMLSPHHLQPGLCRIFEFPVSEYSIF